MKIPLQKRVISVSALLITCVIAMVIIISLQQVRKVGSTAQSLILTHEVILETESLRNYTTQYGLIAQHFSNTSVLKSKSEISKLRDNISIITMRLTNSSYETPEEKAYIDSFLNLIGRSIRVSDLLLGSKQENIIPKNSNNPLIQVQNAIIDSVRSFSNTLNAFENNEQKKEEDEGINNIKYLRIVFYVCIWAVIITIFFIIRKIRIDLAYQSKINEQLSYMAALINQSEDAIISLRNGVIETWNKGAETIYGYTDKEALGRDRYEITRPQLSEAEKNVVMDSLKEKGKWNGEVLHTHKNGEKLYMLLSITVISGDPKSFTTVTIGKNITQHKKDTQKLSLYGTMLENSNDAIITLNSELVITSWNNGAGRVYGYSASEAIGQFEPDFLPVDPQSAYDIANEIKDYEVGGHWIGECIHKKMNGEQMDVSISITLVLNPLTGSKDYVCFVTDITTKKKALEDNFKLTEILNSTDDAIFVTSRETVITNWNKGAEKLYGYTSNEAIGKRSLELLKVDTPLIDFLTFDFKKDQFVKKESTHYKKNGEKVLVDVSLSYKGDLNGNGYFLIIESDITEKKKAEEKVKYLASIIQLSNDAIYTTDTEFRITSWNNGAERMYGYAEAEMIGKTEFTILPAYHPIFTKEDIEENEKNGYFKAESAHRKKNGQVFIVTISLTYLRDEIGKTNGFIIVVNDVTEVKKLESQLKDFNEKLENEVQAKTKELNDVFGRVTDGFIALNNKKCFIYVNKKAGEILRRDWKELVGKSIEKEFEHIDGNFFKVYEKAIATQEYIYFEDYFKSFNSWIEIHFYPASTGVSIYFKDVTHQKKIQEDLIKLNYRFRNLASHLQNARELERINIAREIHDELGQMATAVKIDLSWIKKKMVTENADVKAKMDETILELGEMVNTIRRIAQELRPSILDNLGLTAAIEWYCSDFSKRTGIDCKFENKLGDIELSNNVKTSLFRICQESLTNVMRHSSASKVNCRMEKENSKIMLIVEDNGSGFDTSEKTKSLGLLGMHERALLINGTLKIESKKDSGTKITVEVDF